MTIHHNLGREILASKTPITDAERNISVERLFARWKADSAGLIAHEDESDRDADLWGSIDRAESAIFLSEDTSFRTAEIRLWLMLAHSISSSGPSDMARSEDFEGLSEKAAELDLSERMTLAAIGNLRAAQEAGLDVAAWPRLVRDEQELRADCDRCYQESGYEKGSNDAAGERIAEARWNSMVSSHGEAFYRLMRYPAPDAAALAIKLELTSSNDSLGLHDCAYGASAWPVLVNDAKTVAGPDAAERASLNEAVAAFRAARDASRLFYESVFTPAASAFDRDYQTTAATRSEDIGDDSARAGAWQALQDLRQESDRLAKVSAEKLHLVAAVPVSSAKLLNEKIAVLQPLDPEMDGWLDDILADLARIAAREIR